VTSCPDAHPEQWWIYASGGRGFHRKNFAVTRVVAAFVLAPEALVTGSGFYPHTFYREAIIRHQSPLLVA
jgi:hypothetical protein